MTISAAAMAGAVAIALMGGETPRATETLTPSVADEAVVMSFLVRFQGDGPIARAARTADETAEQVIVAQLRRQIDLIGLCFGGFAGSAEIVLRSCDSIPANERRASEQRWLQRLRAMRGVAYAETETAPTARALH